MKVDRTKVVDGNLANYASAWSVREYTREDGLRPLEARLIDQFFPKPPADVLDVGCGAGRTTGGLACRGYRTVAIDLAQRMLEEARRRYPRLDFRHMDAVNLAFPAGSFDAALFSYNGIDCIYPESDRAACMAQVFRVLRPGGVFLLSTHNVVGAVFSGGYFFLRGYWNAVRMLAMQRDNPLWTEWYVKYRDGGGDQFLYSAPPGRTHRQLEGVGFEVLDVCGRTGEKNPRRIRMHEQHVHFVAKKPHLPDRHLP